MTYLSLIEKLKILFDTLLNFKFILVFVGLFLVFTVMYMLKKVNTKKYTLMMISSFIVLFGISIISNYKVLSSTFDNFTNIFFGNIYFPSIYVYIGVLVVSFIAFITSMLSKMLKRIYKVINGIMFVCNNVLFATVLNIIAKNKIDVFSTSSLYTNTSLVAVLEISMNLFILWVLSLIVVYTTNCICDRIVVKKRVVSADTASDVLVEEVSNGLIPSSDSMIMEEVNCDSMIESDTSNYVSVIEDANIYEDDAYVAKDSDIEENSGNASDVIAYNTTSDVIDAVITCDTKKENSVTFEDILNGNIGAIYYDNNTSADMSYDIINPQEIYEKKYNGIVEDKIEEKTSFQDIVQNIDIPYLDNTIQVSDIEDTVSLEDASLNDLNREMDKKKLIEDRLVMNTLSLDDLNKEDSVSEVTYNENSVSSEKLEGNYSIDDYKRAKKMLNGLKIHAGTSNVSLEDAVTISLISNYSIDDCIKFREILESNLN